MVNGKPNIGVLCENPNLLRASKDSCRKCSDLIYVWRFHKIFKIPLKEAILKFMSTKDHLSCILQTYKKLFDAFDIRLNPREEFKTHEKLHKSLRIVSVLITPELTQRRREIKAALMKESKRIKYGNPIYIWDSDYRKNGLASMREFNPKIGLET